MPWRFTYYGRKKSFTLPDVALRHFHSLNRRRGACKLRMTRIECRQLALFRYHRALAAGFVRAHIESQSPAQESSSVCDSERGEAIRRASAGSIADFSHRTQTVLSGCTRRFTGTLYTLTPHPPRSYTPRQRTAQPLMFQHACVACTALQGREGIKLRESEPLALKAEKVSGDGRCAFFFALFG